MALSRLEDGLHPDTNRRGSLSFGIGSQPVLEYRKMSAGRRTFGALVRQPGVCL